MNSSESIWLNSMGSVNFNRHCQGSHILLLNVFNANPSMNQDTSRPDQLHLCIGRHTTGNRSTSISSGPLMCRPVPPAANVKIEGKKTK